MFCCETNRQCQRILLQYQCPHKLYANITYRNASSAPHVQWYGAGFPCQPFSNAGLQLGVKDHLNRGLLVAHCIDYIQCKKPELVVLENVKRILSKDHLPLLCWILNSLEELGYRTWQSILNTKDYGIPHQRQRLYIVGILRSSVRRQFTWPTPTAASPLDVFLSRGRALPPTGWRFALCFFPFKLKASLSLRVHDASFCNMGF